MPFEAGKPIGLSMESIDCLTLCQGYCAGIHPALLHALQRERRTGNIGQVFFSGLDYTGMAARMRSPARRHPIKKHHDGDAQ